MKVSFLILTELRSPASAMRFNYLTVSFDQTLPRGGNLKASTSLRRFSFPMNSPGPITIGVACLENHS